MLVMIECAWLYVIEFMPTYRFIAISMNKQHFVSISMITGLQHLLMFCFNLVLLEMLYLGTVSACKQWHSDFFSLYYNWRFSEITDCICPNRCLEWQRKRWSTGLICSIGEWFQIPMFICFYDSIFTTSGALRFHASAEVQFPADTTKTIFPSAWQPFFFHKYRPG